MPPAPDVWIGEEILEWIQVSKTYEKQQLRSLKEFGRE